MASAARAPTKTAPRAQGRTGTQVRSKGEAHAGAASTQTSVRAHRLMQQSATRAAADPAVVQAANVRGQPHVAPSGLRDSLATAAIALKRLLTFGASTCTSGATFGTIASVMRFVLIGLGIGNPVVIVTLTVLASVLAGGITYYLADRLFSLLGDVLVRLDPSHLVRTAAQAVNKMFSDAYEGAKAAAKRLLHRVLGGTDALMRWTRSLWAWCKQKLLAICAAMGALAARILRKCGLGPRQEARRPLGGVPSREVGCQVSLPATSASAGGGRPAARRRAASLGTRPASAEPLRSPIRGAAQPPPVARPPRAAQPTRPGRP